MTATKVLLVDDDADIRRVFRFALMSEGFTVTEASDGLEALHLARSEEFDAVVLDLSMPRLDGASMLDNFKTMSGGRQVPIVIVSALDDPAIEERMMQAGATVFLRKPILPARVASAVRRHLAASGE
jgi:two-component system, chemotaxis family, chemotaxis protein CheY